MKVNPNKNHRSAKKKIDPFQETENWKGPSKRPHFILTGNKNLEKLAIFPRETSDK